jgi:ABC-2 type transport system ATP-binding protein
LTALLPTRVSGGSLAISTVGLHKRFGPVQALADAGATVPVGAAYLLAGANGAGKSTLLKLLMGLLRPDEGSISVLGCNRPWDDPSVRATTGFSADDADLGRRRMTVERWLAYHARHYPRWDQAYASRLGAILALPLSRPCHTLSQSEIRRCWLVMALAHRPPLLLLDEPMAGLDPLMRDSVLAILSEHLSVVETTLVVASQEASELAPLMDHLGVLKAGRFVLQASFQEMRAFLRRYRIQLSHSWQPDPLLSGAAHQRIEGDTDAEWTLWGEETRLIAAFESSGAAVREVTEMPVTDAIRVLLRSAPERPDSDV